MRKGYNTNWLWQSWARECRLSAAAIKNGKLEEADRLLARAEYYDSLITAIEISEQLELDLVHPGLDEPA